MPIDGTIISGKVNRGYGIAGLKVGLVHELFRPSGPSDPLQLLNRVGELSVALDARPSYNFQVPALHNDPMRYGLVDGRLLQHGDYLVGAYETVFVAALPHLQPIVCVACNATISLRRTAAPDFGVIDEPVTPGGEVVAAKGWPVSMLYAGRGAGDDAPLPGDAPPPSFMVLAPAIPEISPPHAGDILVDERERRFAVNWLETSSLGWRMNARLLSIA